ncbi:MAG: SWIM zinc finger family protein [Candidatus Dormibacteraceae bacterium]
MPDTIEDAFSGRGVSLLPGGKRDFTTTCSCPDWGDPCKHVAGLCYLLASELDRDPFLLFELRGLSREQLHIELVRSPLGQILASELTPREVPLAPVNSYYTRPTKAPAGAAASLKEFWTGPKRLPLPVESSLGPSVPALTIKKQGDYPAFWKKDASFVEVMEAFYERIRTKSPELR